MMRPPTRTAPMRLRGFTLLEVLVALVVLSIGLIGLAGLQSSSLRFNNDAYLRSQATALAYEMADRMRANAASTGDYSKPTAASAGTANPNCRSTTGCTPVQMAGDDVFLWNQRLGDLLPRGEGTICLDSTPLTANCDGGGADWVIRITWDGDRDGQADPDDPRENVVVSFRP